MQIKTQNATSQERQLTLLDIFTFYLCAWAWHVQKQMKGTADVKRNAEILQSSLIGTIRMATCKWAILYLQQSIKLVATLLSDKEKTQNIE